MDQMVRYWIYIMLRRLLKPGDTGLYVEFDKDKNELIRMMTSVIAINGNRALLDNYSTITNVSFQTDQFDEFAYAIDNHAALFFIDKEYDHELNIELDF